VEGKAKGKYPDRKLPCASRPEAKGGVTPTENIES